MAKPPPQPERWSPLRRQRQQGRETPSQPFFTTSWTTREGMWKYLDNLESVLVMIGQRDMDDDQLDRYARLLVIAEDDALRRISTGRSKTPKRKRPNAA
jgi:hypothetical protein